MHIWSSCSLVAHTLCKGLRDCCEIITIVEPCLEIHLGSEVQALQSIWEKYQISFCWLTMLTCDCCLSNLKCWLSTYPDNILIISTLFRFYIKKGCLWPMNYSWYDELFLAATKQLWEHLFPSVCLSVRPSVTFLTIFPSSFHHEFFRRFSIDRSDVHAKDQGQRSRSQRSKPNLAVSRLYTIFQK